MSGPDNDKFVATEEQRTVVKMLAAIMTPHNEIAKAIINPATRESISPVTLRKYFRDDLDNGAIQVKAFTVGKLFQLVQKGTPSAIFFLLKTKFGFKETSVHEFQGLGQFDLSRLTDAELDDIRAGRITAELIDRLRATAQPGPTGPAQADGGGGNGKAPAGEGTDRGVETGGGGRTEPLADPPPGEPVR